VGVLESAATAVAHVHSAAVKHRTMRAAESRIMGRILV
jgi:hypothetical protein